MRLRLGGQQQSCLFQRFQTDAVDHHDGTSNTTTQHHMAVRCFTDWKQELVLVRLMCLAPEQQLQKYGLFSLCQLNENRIHRRQ